MAVLTIEAAVKHLLEEAFIKIQEVGATFQATYGYDNLDIDLKPLMLTWESTTKDTLVHLTTAAMFPLNHGVQACDLKHSKFMGKFIKDPPLPTTTAELFKAVPSQLADSQGLCAQDRFNAWKFQFDLLHYGPSYFAQFKNQLSEPEEIESITVSKSPGKY